MRTEWILAESPEHAERVKQACDSASPDARHGLEELLAAARHRYRVQGSIFGDSDAGFRTWLALIGRAIAEAERSGMWFRLETITTALTNVAREMDEGDRERLAERLGRS